MQRQLNVIFALFVVVVLSGCKSDEEKIADVFSADLTKISLVPENRITYSPLFSNRNSKSIAIGVLSDDPPNKQHEYFVFFYTYYSSAEFEQETVLTTNFILNFWDSELWNVEYWGDGDGREIQITCEESAETRSFCGRMRPIWDQFYRDFRIMERRREAFQDLQI